MVRSYKIVTGEASADDLLTKKIKTFVHISLCHSMKATTKNVNKYFKVERKFIKYTISLLANSCTLADAFDILEHLFKVLLSKFSDDCNDAKNYLDEKAQADIEKFKELKRTNSTTSTQLESEETETEAIENEFPIGKTSTCINLNVAYFLKNLNIYSKENLMQHKISMNSPIWLQS